MFPAQTFSAFCCLNTNFVKSNSHIITITTTGANESARMDRVMKSSRKFMIAPPHIFHSGGTDKLHQKPCRTIPVFEWAPNYGQKSSR